MIDFGLSYNTTLAEDKAVDLYVLERAFTSAHSALGNLVSSALNPFIANGQLQSNLYCAPSLALTPALPSASMSCSRFSFVQFDDVLASYRQHSRTWCPTLNKFAEGEACDISQPSHRLGCFHIKVDLQTCCMKRPIMTGPLLTLWPTAECFHCWQAMQQRSS